jgi:hypothetical protein
MLVAWLTLALGMLGASSNSYNFAGPTGGARSTAVHRYGCPTFLIRTTETLVVGTGPGMTTTTWSWQPFRLCIIALSLCAWAVVCRFGFVWLVNRSRVAAEQCDECGYDLTGVAHDKCPECGAERAVNT